ncbi:MAG: hypothetical protein RL076_602 [Chloroflexota bacterium]|jgi:tetratricopeptide (TPR) repeat protein
MQSTLLSELMASTHAIKVFWDTLDTDVRTHMLRQLFQSRDLIDKRSKVHAYDDLLAQRLRFRIRSITEKPISWRIEKLLLQCDAQPRVIHDICRRYLTTIHAERFQHIQQMANGSDPEPTNGKYPPEWYLRIVEYLLNDVAPPLPCMLVFSMFAECEGRNEALKDERYQRLWEQHCAWAASRSANPSQPIPDVLVVAVPESAKPVKTVTVRASAVKPPPPEKVVKPVVRSVVLTPPPPLPEAPGNFTDLQFLINRAVEDSCAHIKGALSHEQMRDALAELLRLNSDTVQYYYHFGYFLGLSESKFVVEKQQSQVAQAWSFLGFILGNYRAIGEDVADVIVRNQPLWHLVLTQLNVADLHVVYRLIPALIEHKSYDEIADIMTHIPLPGIRFAEHPDSVAMQLFNVAADLVRGGTHLPQADRILQILIEQLSAEGMCGNLYGRCLRKRGQFYRRKKQFNQAGELFRAAIAVPEFSEIAQTHADIGMSMAGYAGLDAMLPSDANDFRIVTQALKFHKQHFDDAVACVGGDDTNAQFALGLLDFGNGDYQNALEHFRLAQIGMERQLSAYRVRDLYDWLLFLKIRTWSQHLELSEIPVFRDELAHVFIAQTFFPLKHWLQIFRDVSKVDAETGRKVMLHLFTYRDVDIYDLCSIEEVFRHTSEIWRRYFFGSAKYNALNRADKFAHLTQAWQIVLLSQNADATDFVLELLELFGSGYSDYAAPVHKLIIEFLEDILRMWDETDVLHLRVQLLFMMGQSDEALSLLVQLCNIYLGRQEVSQARAIYAWLVQLRYTEIAHYAQILQGQKGTQTTQARCRVLYIGGNETQQSFKDEIDTKLASAHPHIQVEWELIGWSSNWGDEAARIERRIPDFDLVILSPYVRTLFGRQIRKAASNWRASTGKGQGKIYADIVAAVDSFQAQ